MTMTERPPHPAPRSRRAGLVGLALVAAAVGLLVLLQVALAQPEPVCGGDYGEDCTTYPLGKVVAYGAAVLAIALGCAGLVALVAAAVLGPAPWWWRRPDGSPVPGGSLLPVVAVITLAGYSLWALPWLQDYSEPLPLLVGAVLFVAAMRAASPLVAFTLGAAAAGLVLLGGGEASILLLHGLAAIALATVALIAVGRRGWARGTAIALLALGVPAWLYGGLILVLFFGCEQTGGCLN